MESLKVIYEDNHIIVVEKKPNVPSQEDITKDIDMLTKVKNYIKEKYNKPGNVYIGLVHRLDRPVGGVMVFARTSKAASRLSEQIRNKTLKKKYLALVKGKVSKTKDTLIDYLYKDEKNNITKVVSSKYPESKMAKLDYEVVKYDQEKDLTLLKINLHTGRHHQIRVQLANMGHSIYGDCKYGKNSKNTQIRLWAYELEIEHPTTKQIMKFKDLPNWA